ncbi:MAG: DUF5711 family protein [Defluviitaleaceae bacterium]|nr:DUF5711 family protein [Defluviitaleaceae bacterium]
MRDQKRTDENGRSDKKNNLMVKIAAVILAVSVAFYIYTDIDAGSLFGSNDSDAFFSPTDVAFQYESLRDVFFFATENGDFFYCTNNFVRFLTPTGQVRWETSIDVLNPFVVGNGSYIAIGEVNGRIIYVFGRSGLLYTRHFETQNILNFAVNRQGFASVVLQSGSSYETIVLNSSGTEIWRWMYHLPGIYPIATAISHDSRILANSTLEVNERLVSQVFYAFLNRNEAAAHTDTIFMSMIRPGQVIPEVHFLDNRTAVLLSDSEISGVTFTGGSDVRDEWSKEIGNRIDDFAIFDRGIAVAFGEGVINQNQERPGTVNFYNASGEVTGTFFGGDRVTYMSSNGNNIVIGVGRTFYGVTDRGRILWQFDATTDLRDVFILNNSNTILTVSQTEATVLRRGR